MVLRDSPTPSSLAQLHSINARLWRLATDAEVARAWGGSVLTKDYREVSGSDFNRAMDADDNDEFALDVGDGKGVIASVKGGDGWSFVFPMDGGIALAGHNAFNTQGRGIAGWPNGASEYSDDLVAQLGQCLVDLPAKPSEPVGRFDVHSGCIALLLPYVEVAYSAGLVVEIAAGTEARSIDEDLILIPMPNGPTRSSPTT